MVICMVKDCGKQTDRLSDRDVSFHRIPAVTDHQGEADYQLRKRRRDGYLAAVSRKDVDLNALDRYRICSRHFEGGQPASLYDTTHPGWLPTLHMGHENVRPADNERYERLQRRHTMQEMWDHFCCRC